MLCDRNMLSVYVGGVMAVGPSWAPLQQFYSYDCKQAEWTVKIKLCLTNVKQK